MFLLLLLQVSYEIITYDSGLFVKFDYKANGNSFLCRTPALRIQTVFFQDVFENIPQVILTANKIDYGTELANEEVKITEITLTNFTLYLDCPNNSNSWGLKLLWYAIDDQRIQVYSYFNQYKIENKSVPLNNLNADSCFVSLISLGLQGRINFSIYVFIKTISQLDNQEYNAVQVKIILNPGVGNMVQIGYQVVCGISQAIKQMGLFFTDKDGEQNTLDLVPNMFLLTPFRQINWLFTNSLRLEKNFTQNSTHITIYPNSWNARYFSNTIDQIWVSYKITNIFTSLICQTIRISQILDLYTNLRYNFSIAVKELNLSFNQPGIFTLKINKSFSTLNIIVYSKCQKGKKITGQVKRCNMCQNSQNYNLSQNCYGAINQIIYSARFIQTIEAYEELIITITENSCTIQQVLYNQIKTTETLAFVQSVMV